MVTIIDTSEEFEKLRDDWSELLQASSANCFFLTWEWLFSWWRHLSGGRKLFILTIRSTDKMIAAAPFTLKPARFSGSSVVEFLGSGAAGSDYLDLIVRHGYEDEAVAALAEYLSRQNVLLALSQLGTSALALSLGRRLVAQTGYRSFEIPLDVCPYIDLTDQTWKSYLGSLGGSHRANFQRRQKQLRREFSFRFERAANEEQRRRFLGALIDLHCQRWRDRGSSEAFSTADMISFHEEVSRRALERGWLRLFLMSLNDRPAAALYGFQRDRRFYFFQSGLAPEYSRYSVGLVTMGLAIQDAIENGAHEYDLLHGDESYKFLWARETHEIRKIELYPPNAAGRVYGGIAQAGRAARRFARTILPKPVAERIATARRMAQVKGYYAAPSR